MRALTLIKRLTPAIPEQQAWWLLSRLTGRTQAKLLAMDDLMLTAEQVEQLEEWLHDIAVDAKPIQYILGTVFFGSLEMAVEPPVLIPRPETEEWVIELINDLKALKNEPLKILDLCTGTGCIGLSLAEAFLNSKVVVSDISEDALLLAEKNKRLNAVANVTIVPSDLFEYVEQYGPYDLIVANPPYIPSGMFQSLDRSVKEWEDRKALLAGDDGLSVIKKIIERSSKNIKPDGVLAAQNKPVLVFEIDCTQGDAVRQLLVEAGFATVTIKQDSAGRDRVALACL
jgi:release factor glutamine methyltransferase